MTDRPDSVDSGIKLKYQRMQVKSFNHVGGVCMRPMFDDGDDDYEDDEEF